MGKKVTQQDYPLPAFLQDERYMPDSIRPLTKKLPRIPLMVSKPYPDSNPGAWIQKGVSFFSSGEYTIDTQNNIYFNDPETGKEIYLNKVDSTNYNHRAFALAILNDLSQKTNTVRLPSGRDTTVYSKNGIGLVHSKQTSPADNVIGTDRIEFNMNYQGGGIIANYYALLSVYRHEYLHVVDTRTKITDLEHAQDIYKTQMSYEEFAKAPSDFQLGIILTYGDFVVKGCYAMNITKSEIMQRRFFDKFNQDVGDKIGASITFDRDKAWYFTVKVKGGKQSYFNNPRYLE